MPSLLDGSGIIRFEDLIKVEARISHIELGAKYMDGRIKRPDRRMGEVLRAVPSAQET